MAHLIQTQADLDARLADLAREPAVALDTETDAFFAYRPRICLLQISVPGLDLLVDPLADLDLSGLGALLADPARETVLHAAENDVIHMKHEYGWRIGRLFDTQVACFVLGLPPYSLAGVLEERFGVKLDKKMQRSDWSRRPLSSEQITYAAEDTRWLLGLAADLHARAREAGREDEIAAECARIAGRDWEPEPFDPEGYRRMAGARDLNGVGLRVLRELYLFRAAEAERRNRAPYRIAPDALLVQLARGRRGGAPSFWKRYGSRVESLIRKARADGPLDPPRRPRRAAEPMPADVKARYEALRRWRAEAAVARGVEPWVVARNELLLQVAQRNPARAEDLHGIVEPFRLREYGEAMIGIVRGSLPDAAQ